MFWKYNNNTSSELEALLAKEDITLMEVMDAEDIINQCKVQSKTLIDFLIKPEVMEELINLITREPSMDIDERVRFKYPNIACELLTSDVSAINERLASDEVLLDKLYGFLECEPPLNPLLASYFSKTMGALITKKTEQVLDFLKAKDTFISLLLKHLGTSAIMDLMLKLMTQVETVEMKQNILNWLDSQSIMQSLVSLLNPKVDTERHYNVAQLLCDFVKIARDMQRNSSERVDPDPLLNTLESSETITLLLDNIFEGSEKSESAIVGGIQVLATLLDVDQSSIPRYNLQIPYNSNTSDETIDVEHKERVIKSTTDSILNFLKKFHDLLLNPPKRNSISTTVGVLEKPLGNTRLQVSKLIAIVVSSNSKRLVEEIVALGTFTVLLDLFFSFPWNNFLHTQVEKCLISALKLHTSDEPEENSNALSRHLLVNCNVIERILKAWKDNDEQQKANGLRQGYMGHLINIINKIVELCSSTSLGKFFIDNMPEVAKSLDEFKDSTLKEANTLQDTLLGGAYPNSSNEENDDYCDAVPQEPMYSNYQAQHLTSLNLNIEGYSGFNDDAFNDGDDTLQSIDHRTDMNFCLTDGELAQQHEMFKQVCAQSISTLDDADDQIFEERDHTFETVIEKADQNDTVYSSDSDDDSSSGGGGGPMDVDPWMSPKTADISPILPADPWSSNPEPKASDMSVGDWADFSSASFETSFGAAFQNPDEAKVNCVSKEKNDKEKGNATSIEDIAQKKIDCATVGADIAKQMGDLGDTDEEMKEGEKYNKSGKNEAHSQESLENSKKPMLSLETRFVVAPVVTSPQSQPPENKEV